MHAELRQAFEATLAHSRDARARGDLAAAFAALQRAHVLGQRYLWPHLRTHALMLALGWRRRQLREIAGQLLRLVATPLGWLSGWVPKGNTGGADVSALRPMPMPAELAELADFSVRRDVLARLATLLVLWLGVWLLR